MTFLITGNEVNDKLLHNILGRAKSGKTEYILGICERMIREKRHTFLIVPEQGALAFERMVMERLGNVSNEYIEVINFKRLCNRVFRETGGLTQNYIDGARKLLIMNKAVCSVRDMLCLYKEASLIPDFIQKAVSVIAEFRLYGINPEMLEKAAVRLEESGNTRLCCKLRDFALIYSAYGKTVTDMFGEDFNYRDSTDDLERLATVLCDEKFFRGKTVIIDSFYGFTSPELSVIDRMVRDADDVYVTYLAETDTEDVLFSRGRKAYDKICTFAKDNFIEYEDIVTEYGDGYENTNLKNLEKNFAHELRDGNSGLSDFTGDGVSIYKCENAYGEAKCAAAIINYLVRKCGARFSDIAILSRNPDSLCGILDTELSKNSIPFGFSMKYDLLTRPVATYIISAFEFIKNKSQQSVLKMLKSGLTELSDEEADLVECYIKTWNIRGNMFTDSEWMMNPDGYNSAAEMTDRSRHILEIVHNAREKLITPLTVFDEDIRSAVCADDISRAVVRLLSCGKYSLCELSDDEIVYHNMIMDALDCISDIYGNEYISPSDFAVILEMILSEYDTGSIPATVDEVDIASAELYRSAKNSYMIVLGLNDGIFPANPSPDNVFSDRERNLLSDMGLELSGTSADKAYDELFLAYKAVCSPSKELFLIYSEKDTNGDKLSASPVISMCLSALSGLREKKDTELMNLYLYLSKNSLASEISPENPERSKAISDFLLSKGIKPKSDMNIRADYLSKDTAAKLYGYDLLLSPSRLDRFNYCAHSYFGTYTLALSPERKAELGPSETGNIVHKILELLICELSEMKQSGKEITVEYAVKRQHELLEAYIGDLVGEKAKKELSKRFRYLYSRLSGALDACVGAMTEEIIQAEFIPKDFEMSIGTKNADIPFASIPIIDGEGKTEGTLTINGKIDRTDIYQKNGKVYIRVADYKTGNKKFNLADVSVGLNLQMLLYLYSLTKNCGTRYGDYEAVPAGVLYTPIHRPSLSFELGEEVSSDIKKEFHTNGILIDDIEILRAMEKNLEGKFIPAKLKKDGSFYSTSSISSLETMGRLLNCAADVASKLALEMKKGKIAKNPYKCDINSCAFCDLAPFCRYENGESGTRYVLTKYTDEVFEKSAGGDE